MVGILAQQLGWEWGMSQLSAAERNWGEWGKWGVLRWWLERNNRSQPVCWWGCKNLYLHKTCCASECVCVDHSKISSWTRDKSDALGLAGVSGRQRSLLAFGGHLWLWAGYKMRVWVCVCLLVSMKIDLLVSRGAMGQVRDPDLGR